MTSLQPQQPPNITSSTVEARYAYIITIQDGEYYPNRTSSFINPSLQFISISSFNTLQQTALTPDHPNPNSSDQLLTQTILRFTLCAVLPLLTLVQNTESTAKPLEWFIFFLLIAFCTSVAAIASSRDEQGNAVAFFRYASVLSIALAFASIASLFMGSWFQVAAYGFCAVPLYALVPAASFEYLLRKLNKVKLWWKRIVEVTDQRQIHGASA